MEPTLDTHRDLEIHPRLVRGTWRQDEKTGELIQIASADSVERLLEEKRRLIEVAEQDLRDRFPGTRL